MSRQDQIISERLRKINELNKKDINPYPHKYEVKDYASQLQEKHKSLKKGGKTKNQVSVAGRLMSLRDFGKINFGVLQDSTGKIQVIVQDKETPAKVAEFFKKYVDAGDFIGVEGTIFRTERGELSVLVKKMELLSKSILPLPEKWHGLQDEEERYRKRYLDLIINPDVRKIFETRAVILQAMREFMTENKFIEIETPILQPVYGGALAKPFKTHIDAYNKDVYLSIAPELPLKKALVGGFERVYEITKKFRNEGVDRSHNPEHMSIEWYQAYASYEEGMDLFEEFMKSIAKKVFGKTTFEYQGHKIDLSKWKRISLDKAIKEYLGEDVSRIKTDQEAVRIAKKHGINADGITKTNISDELMKLFRDKLIQPTFLTDYPIESSPLAKPKRGDPTKAEVFQPFVGGLELARAYSELSDPLLQESNFLEQEKDREKGNKEAMPTDVDFVIALKHGMPPACGVGVGVERVVMLLTNQTSIRDVILFPFMKPEGDKETKEEKSKESRIAVAVINKSLKLKPWQQMNTIAHLNAAFGARIGRELFMQDTIETKDSQKIKLNIQHAIMIKEIHSNKDIMELIKDARKLDLEINEFTREMIETTDDRKVAEWTKNKNIEEVEFLGVLIFGKKSSVDKLTENLKLFEGFNKEEK